MRFFIRLFLLIIVLFAAVTACAGPFSPRLIRGSGNVVVQERQVSDFNEIMITGVGRVFVTQGDTESLSIETDDNLMEYIETRVRGNTLEIGFTDDTSFSPGGGRKILEPTDGFVFQITAVELKGISLSGAARFEVEKLKTDQLDVNLSGAGDIRIEDLNANQLDVVVSGAGDVELSGKVDEQQVNLSGLGRYQAYDLASHEAAVTISGAGGAELWVTEALDVTISGAGDVKYFGDPAIIPEISGVGRIQSQGEK